MRLGFIAMIHFEGYVLVMWIIMLGNRCVYVMDGYEWRQFQFSSRDLTFSLHPG